MFDRSPAVGQRAVPLDELHLRFCDVIVHLYADSASYLNLFRTMYGCFAIGSSARTVDPLHPATVQERSVQEISVQVLTSRRYRSKSARLIIDGEVTVLADPVQQQGFVYERVVQHALSKVRTHLLIHAAAVAWQGRGILIAGAAGSGKTTLALALTHAGATLLSDELAPLRTASSSRRLLIDPFPRALRVRPDTCDRLPFEFTHRPTPIWMGKQIIPWEEPAETPTSELDHVVLLDHGPAPSPEQSRHQTEVEIVLGTDNQLIADNIADDLLSSVVARSTTLGHTRLLLQPPHIRCAVQQIEDRCRSAGIPLIAVAIPPAASPSFAGPARLTRLEPWTGVMRMMRHAQNGPTAAGSAAAAAGAGATLFTWLAHLRSAMIWQMQPGPLDEMVELLRQLPAAAAPQPGESPAP